MTLSFAENTLPLSYNTDGVIRVGNTRVTLDTVIFSFNDGSTAEEIAQQFPTLQLADIYQVIAYYLHQPDDVNTYLQERNIQIERVRAQNEARFDPTGIRDRLMSRKN